MRAGSSSLASLVVLALASCASTGAEHQAATQAPSTESSARAVASQARALELMELAEAAHAGGDRILAVALWRRSFLALSPDPQHDATRQALVLRIGQGLMELHRIDGDSYHLAAAQQMLERWLEARNPDQVDPRDLEELYALLGEVELRMEQPPGTGSGDGEEEREAGERLRDRTIALMQRADTPDGGGRDATHRGETLGAKGLERDVLVPNGRLADVDDPEVRFILRTDGGVSLLSGRDGPLNPTRALVRAGAPKVATDGFLSKDARGLARKETWRLVRELRGDLEGCYTMSLVRQPSFAVRQVVELEARKNGAVIVVESQGDPLGDRAGDLCVARVFASARVDPALAGHRFASLPLTFFVQREGRIQPTVAGEGIGMGDSVAEADRERAADNQPMDPAQ